MVKKKNTKLKVTKVNRFVYVRQQKFATPGSDPTTVITTTLTWPPN